MEPHVSDPMAKVTSPAPTAEPDPLEEPSLHRLVSHWLTPGPVKDDSGWDTPKPPASSIIASLATSTPSPDSSRLTTVASKSNLWARNGSAPQVVGIPPEVASRSFTL